MKILIRALKIFFVMAFVTAYWWLCASGIGGN